MSDSDKLMKLAHLEEMRNAIKLTDLSLQLTDVLHSHLEFLIRASEKSGIQIPDIDRTIELMKKEKALVEQIYDLGISPDRNALGFHPKKEQNRILVPI